MTRTTLLGLVAGLTLTAAPPACRTNGPSDASADTPVGDAAGRDSADGAPELPANDAALADSPGACLGDDDCLFAPTSDCCGLCLALRDPAPPPRACGTTCPPSPPPCLCQQGRCRTGTLPRNAGCDPARDLCGRGLKCCNVCSGAPGQPDGNAPPLHQPRLHHPPGNPVGPAVPHPRYLIRRDVTRSARRPSHIATVSAPHGNTSKVR